MKLLPKDHQLLDYIGSYIDEHKFAPTYKEMMDGTGTTTKGTIFNRLERLVRAEKIFQIPGSSRAIRILEE